MSYPQTKRTNIFIYGTLKRGCRNYHRYMLDNKEGMRSFFVGPHEVIGHKLVILTHDIPGIVHTGNSHDVVVGEIHAVEPDLLQTLIYMEQAYDFKPLPGHYSEVYYFIERQRKVRSKAEQEYYFGLKEIPLDNEGKFNYTPALNEKLVAEVWDKEYAHKQRLIWSAHLTPRRNVA